jgi:hypothetical protein
VKKFDGGGFSTYKCGVVIERPGELIMKIGFRILPAIALAAALVLVPRVSLADHCGNGDPHCLSSPAPLIGAGLPGIAIAIGYGAYLLVRRRRNVT